MRVAACVVMCLVGCMHDIVKLQRDACEAGDPDGCLASARERLAAKDDDAARDYLEKQAAIVTADRACMTDHTPVACFHGVVTILREPAVGVLADYAIEPQLLNVLRPWNGSDADGPHAQARRVLEPMCTGHGQPIDRERACLALGDLVLLERTKHVDGYDNVIDGYAEACTLHVADPLLATVYHVNDPCAVATSAARGASIFEASAQITRILNDATQRDASAADAAQREAARLAEMRKHEADAAVARAKAAAITSSKQIVSAAAAEDWDLLLDAARARPGLDPLDDTAATALANAWDPFTAWLVGASGLVGAQLELGRDLRDAIPSGSALARVAGAFRDRAVAEAKRLAKLAGGPGGRFLHAALIAQASGDKADDATARAAFEALQKTVRTTLVLDNLAPACAALVKTVPGKPLHVAATLACTIEPEHTWTEKESFMVNGVSTPTDIEHRGYKLVVHGTVGPVPVDLDDIVDETTDTLDRSFAKQLDILVTALWTQLVAPADAATAADALAAGQRALAQGNIKRAENELAIHAVIAGSSEELDKLLAPYRVTFGQLVPTP